MRSIPMNSHSTPMERKGYQVYHDLWNAASSPKPLRLDIEVTTRCLNRCKKRLCLSPPECDMKRELALLVVKAAEECGIPSISLNGGRGDPLLIGAENLKAIVSRARKAKCIVDVVAHSGGASLRPEESSALLEGGLDRLVVTIPSVETCQLQEDTDSEVIGNLKQFMFLRRFLGAKRTKVTVRSVAALSSEVGVDYDFWGDKADILTEGGICSSVEGMYSAQMCLSPWRRLTILSDGVVVPCSRLSRLTLGNIRFDSPLDMWRHESIRDLRYQWRSGHITPECAKCFGEYHG